MNYQKFVPNYQFAFRCFAHAHGDKIALDKQRISDLTALEKVRNRVTHPKCSTDLIVSIDDVKLAQSVLNWHIKVSGDVFDMACKAQNQATRRLLLRREVPFTLTLPVTLFWKDGDVYEFPTKKAARGFAKAKGGKAGNIDFTITSLRDAAS
jgi:hypothetical protein